MNCATTEKKEPDIFDYYNYRQYLNDLVEFKRASSAAFSHRAIVQKAGFKSPTALKHVIDGKRNLSLEAANQFAVALRIEGIPRHYFLTMVLFNQSTSVEEQERYLNELIELKRAESPSRIEDDQMEVLSQWYHLAVRELTELPDFKKSPAWIAQVLCPPITPFEASESLRLLERCGLVVKEGRALKPAHRTISADPQVHSLMLAAFHRQMIALGSDAISSFTSEVREISGTTLRISLEDVNNIRMLLREFRKKLLAVAAHSARADQVYQFNVQFFPLVNTDSAVRTRLAKEKT